MSGTIYDACKSTKMNEYLLVGPSGLAVISLDKDF
jgi:hypothetical protein